LIKAPQPDRFLMKLANETEASHPFCFAYGMAGKRAEAQQF
jgi:hypothetical protein